MKIEIEVKRRRMSVVQGAADVCRLGGLGGGVFGGGTVPPPPRMFTKRARLAIAVVTNKTGGDATRPVMGLVFIRTSSYI